MLKVAESVVTGGCRREKHYPSLRRMFCAPGNYLRVVVLNEALRIENWDLRMYSSSGLADKNKILYLILFQKIDERRIVDPTVEATKDERVDTAEGLDCSDGSGGNGGDAVVVPCDATIGADFLHAVTQPVESG